MASVNVMEATPTAPSAPLPLSTSINTSPNLPVASSVPSMASTELNPETYSHLVDPSSMPPPAPLSPQASAAVSAAAAAASVLPPPEPRYPYDNEYSIFVGDLAPTLREEDLVAQFIHPPPWPPRHPLVLRMQQHRMLDGQIRCAPAPFQSTKGAKIMTDPVTQQSRGFGFVRFYDQRDAQRALIEMQGVYIQPLDGTTTARPLRVSPATPKKHHHIPFMPLPQPYPPPQPSDPHALVPPERRLVNERMATATTSAIPTPMPLPPVEREERPMPERLVSHADTASALDPYNATVFVGGLGPNVPEDTLRTLFSPFGEIVYVKIPRGKGCGFVAFAAKADAQRAIDRMAGFPIQGSRIRLSWGRSQSDKVAAGAAAVAAAQAHSQTQMRILRQRMGTGSVPPVPDPGLQGLPTRSSIQQEQQRQILSLDPDGWYDHATSVPRPATSTMGPSAQGVARSTPSASSQQDLVLREALRNPVLREHALRDPILAALLLSHLPTPSTVATHRSDLATPTSDQSKSNDPLLGALPEYLRDAYWDETQRSIPHLAAHRAQTPLAVLDVNAPPARSHTSTASVASLAPSLSQQSLSHSTRSLSPTLDFGHGTPSTSTSGRATTSTWYPDTQEYGYLASREKARAAAMTSTGSMPNVRPLDSEGLTEYASRPPISGQTVKLSGATSGASSAAIRQMQMEHYAHLIQQAQQQRTQVQAQAQRAMYSSTSVSPVPHPGIAGLGEGLHRTTSPAHSLGHPSSNSLASTLSDPARPPHLPTSPYSAHASIATQYTPSFSVRDTVQAQEDEGEVIGLLARLEVKGSSTTAQPDTEQSNSTTQTDCSGSKLDTGPQSSSVHHEAGSHSTVHEVTDEPPTALNQSPNQAQTSLL